MSGTSTFHGLETARRAMTAHQAALYTTGHNIANSNTPGYTRQRVNLTPTEAFPSPAFNKPNIPGQIGTGVRAGEVQRIRQSFLDVQFREEHNKYGYWSARHTALEKMEDILNEPTTDGIANTLDRFWQSLQDLSVHPEDSGARSVVRQRGMAIAEKFNYTYNSLDVIRNDYKAEIGVQVDRINSLTRQISSINEQIAAVEPHGYLANDLYDKRDLLVDELSTFANIKVQEVASGGNASSLAEGRYTIKLLDNNGFDMGYTLVDGSKLTTNELTVHFEDDDSESELVTEIQIGNHTMNINQFHSTGQLRATIEAYGYKDGNVARGIYPEMQEQLNTMVATFVDEFNRVHREGWSLSEIEDGSKANGGAGFDFFVYDPDSPAKSLQVHEDIYASLDNIAASSSADGMYSRMDFVSNTDPDAYAGDANFPAPSVTGVYTGTPQELSIRWHVDKNTDGDLIEGTGRWQFQDLTDGVWKPLDEIPNLGIIINTGNGEPAGPTEWKITLTEGWNPSNSAENSFSGDGSNALALANVKDTRLNFSDDSTTNVQSFYQAVIGDMAVRTNEAERMTRNTETLRDSVEDRRQSVSGVSLDEEMTDMIRFQHAYNAAARNITVIDEMLDRIINGMGIVGR